LRRHGEHSGDAEGYACRLRVLVDPEGDPGQHHDEYRRDVRLEDKEPDFTVEEERRLETGEVA